MPALNGEVKADRVKPTKGAKQLPGVLVIYENRRLNPYINDVARRFANALSPSVVITDGLFSSTCERDQYLLKVTPTTRKEFPDRATLEQCVPPRSQLLNLMQS